MPPDHPNQPHDGLIRTALDSLDNARTAIAAALPRELLAHLDLSRLRRVPARVVDSLLSARESDAVWEVPFANVDRSLLAHLMAEVQSTPDVDLVLRTLGLQVRFWERQRRLGQPLSPVIPLVISHGATWRAPRTMLERLGMPPELERLLAPFIPTSTYVLEDLARFSPEALAARPELSVQLRVTYFLLQRSRSSAALEEELKLILDDLRTLSENEAARDFLTRLLRYTYHTANGDIRAVHGMLRANLDPLMETQMGTLAEQLIERGVQKGRAEGIQKGRAEGIQEGVARGQRETLARLLTLKFGPLPGAATERLASATHDELAAYTLRVLKAESLDAVFE
jgi:predicted transposase YdaD